MQKAHSPGSNRNHDWSLNKYHSCWITARMYVNCGLSVRCGVKYLLVDCFLGLPVDRQNSCKISFRTWTKVCTMLHHDYESTCNFCQCHMHSHVIHMDSLTYKSSQSVSLMMYCKPGVFSRVQGGQSRLQQQFLFVQEKTHRWQRIML